jgi:uncharacterized membrane protein
MTGSFAWLALAAAFLLASHFGLSSTGLRGSLARAVGERGFLAVYSLVAVIALYWLVLAWRAAPYAPLWDQAPWQWAIPLALVPVALVLAVAGLSQPNPSGVGGGSLLEREEPVRGILRITRNPLMWGIGLWALAHLAPNGDLASVTFFGTLAILALVGTMLIDRKKAARHGIHWERFAEVTSNLPFGAVVKGRQSLGRAVREIGWVRLAAAVALYAALLHGHRLLFGVSPLPPV